MQPAPCMIRLRGEHFGRGHVVCLGWQLARVIDALSRTTPSMLWYCADVDTNGLNPFYSDIRSQVMLIGEAQELLSRVVKVDQFWSGIFFGVSAPKASPRLRENSSTEDAVPSDMGDALVEVRAFDTTYIEVVGVDCSVFSSLFQEFPAVKAECNCRPE